MLSFKFVFPGMCLLTTSSLWFTHVLISCTICGMYFIVHCVLYVFLSPVLIIIPFFVLSEGLILFPLYFHLNFVLYKNLTVCSNSPVLVQPVILSPHLYLNSVLVGLRCCFLGALFGSCWRGTIPLGEKWRCKARRWSGGKTPHILNNVAKYTWVIIFKLWPLYLRTRNERKSGWEDHRGKWCGYRIYSVWLTVCTFAD